MSTKRRRQTRRRRWGAGPFDPWWHNVLVAQIKTLRAIHRRDPNGDRPPFGCCLLIWDDPAAKSWSTFGPIERLFGTEE